MVKYCRQITLLLVIPSSVLLVIPSTSSTLSLQGVLVQSPPPKKTKNKGQWFLLRGWTWTWITEEAKQQINTTSSLTCQWQWVTHTWLTHLHTWHINQGFTSNPCINTLYQCIYETRYCKRMSHTTSDGECEVSTIVFCSLLFRLSSPFFFWRRKLLKHNK